jgi:hypothetical protein
VKMACDSSPWRICTHRFKKCYILAERLSYCCRFGSRFAAAALCDNRKERGGDFYSLSLRSAEYYPQSRRAHPQAGCLAALWGHAVWRARLLSGVGTAAIRLDLGL